jgi:spermidine synthase
MAANMGRWLYPKPGTNTENNANPAQREPFVFDDGTTKSLFFSLDQLQSRMNKSQPDALEVDYTKTMMAFLLLARTPNRLGMIGLGGGSLVRFCHRHLPHSHMTVAEINPAVIALRDEFLVPPDSERLKVLLVDGADFVRSHRGTLDVLLVDGFDHDGQSTQLCSQAFYDDCHRALDGKGVLVVNLHHDHPEHALFMSRIRQSFGAGVFELASKEKSNSVVFACKTANVSLEQFRERASLDDFSEALRQQLKAEFDRLAWLIQKTR